MDKDSRIYVAGHRGMAGGAVCRALQAQGFRRIVTEIVGKCALKILGSIGIGKLQLVEYGKTRIIIFFNGRVMSFKS